MTYRVAQNPKDKLWYVVGNCGGGYWIPVSDGFASKANAELRSSFILMADRAAKRELEGV